MPRRSRSDRGAEAAGGGVHSGEPDARLTELLRGDAATAYPALRELRRRHHAPTLAYARLLGADEAAAKQLTAQAFALGARDTGRGVDPTGPWRHHAALLVRRIAATWTADGRRVRLRPEFAAFLDAEEEDRADLPAFVRRPPAEPPMTAAFHSLPTRTQGVLRYGIVDAAPDPETALYLGLKADEVAWAKGPSLDVLGRAFLKAQLDRHGDQSCQGYRRLIEEAVRPREPRRSDDLYHHLARCPCCEEAHNVLLDLRRTPRTVLAAGLLPWNGGAYIPPGVEGPVIPVIGGTARLTDGAARLTGGAEDAGAGADRGGGRADAVGAGESPAAAAAAAAGGVGVGVGGTAGGAADGGQGDDWNPADDRDRPWRPTRGFVLAALTVALAPLLVVLSGGGAGEEPSPDPDEGRRPGMSPPATAPGTPTRSASAPSAVTPSAPRATTSPSTSVPSAVVRPPGGAYTQFVNASTDLCLDVRDGDFFTGNDVVMSACNTSDTQRWRFDISRGLVRSWANEEFCLDSRGSVDKGVGIRRCAPTGGRDDGDLRFDVDPKGRVLPKIASGHAVTPTSKRAGGGVGHLPLGDATAQRWRAGEAPV